MEINEKKFLSQYKQIKDLYFNWERNFREFEKINWKLLEQKTFCSSNLYNENTLDGIKKVIKSFEENTKDFKKNKIWFSISIDKESYWDDDIWNETNIKIVWNYWEIKNIFIY